MKPTAYLWNIPDVPKDAKNKQYLYFKDPSCACGDIFKKDIIPLYTIKQVREMWYDIDRYCEDSIDRWDSVEEKSK